jgi:hypothetical protein
LVPTASQVVTLGQATPWSSEVPETTWSALLAEAGMTLSTMTTGMARADAAIKAAMRDRDQPLATAHRIAGHTGLG